MGKTMMTLEMLGTAIAMSCMGANSVQIAERLGISRDTAQNYVYAYKAFMKGKKPCAGTHYNHRLLEEYIKNNTEEGLTMDRGTKMTSREVEKIMALKGAGKSDSQIAQELNRSQSTVSMYVDAVKQAINGTFVHQSSSGVRAELIEPYIRKEGKLGKIEQEITANEVKKANTPRGEINPENALMIANELECKTPVDIIARLMRVDIATIGKVRAYIGWLKEKDNDRAVEWKKSGALTDETCEALESLCGFFPKERTEEEKEKSWQESVTASQELMLDFLDSIESSLRKISGLLEKMIPQT